MIAAAETFRGTFPFAPHYSSAPGFRMHYVDEGAGSVLLCLHGEPTWGYLFRDLVRRFSPTHRVVVPDHMGFGKSETPADRTYWLQDHIDNLESLILDLDLDDITLVMHDFGGPVGMGLAARHPDRIARVVSINGPTPFGQPGLAEALEDNGDESPWFRWIAQANQSGTLENVLGELKYNILSTLKLNGFENNQIISETWIEAYGAPFPTPAESRGAIGWAKGFATGAHVFEAPTDAARAKLAEIPALAIWGGADRTLNSAYFLPLFTSAFPDGIVTELPGVGHYSIEDAPDTVGELLSGFLDATTTSPTHRGGGALDE
ncbi:haloalkane dehalogenase 1 [Planotetraspora silvatica]|uniref:Haloalkane dehalogenase 1 n=1 Tax=Planotetraspora silvatica TaxID=234614 RepID=A0A8J3UP10_9ACTN|nr:alpha/beta fold hydrolase [Planotetraspora silvatica]GII47292.1 haloalkane dehalogenase 1 [Planotetraspora silvatica]